MKTHRFYFASLLIIFSASIFSSCSKNTPTSINGTVIDAHTGAPVDSALLNFSIRYNNIDNFYFSGGHFAYTDPNGQFNYLQEDGAQVIIFEVRKNGYLPRGVGGYVADIIQGEANDVEIRIIPKDGLLRLNIDNNTTLADTVYVAVFSQNQLQEAGISGGVMLREKFDISGLTHFQFDLALSSGEDAIVYWSFAPPPYSLDGYPFKESVPITKNDTTAFTISF